MKRNSLKGVLLLPALLVLFFACQKEISKEENEAYPEQASAAKANYTASSGTEKLLQTDLLKAVHSSTARYQSTTQAIKASYVPDPRCVSVPGRGGMGYHWVNKSLIDAVFDPLTPEVMLYATGSDGKLKLVAVEYLVMDAGQPVPMFDSQVFDDRSGAPITAHHWSLHVWLYEHNPAGMFKPFNPNITCP